MQEGEQGPSKKLRDLWMCLAMQGTLSPSKGLKGVLLHWQLMPVTVFDVFKSYRSFKAVLAICSVGLLGLPGLVEVTQ